MAAASAWSSTRESSLVLGMPMQTGSGMVVVGSKSARWVRVSVQAGLRTVEPGRGGGALALRLDLARVELCEARSRGEWVAQLGQGAEGGGHARRAPTPKSSILHAPAL